MEQCSMETKIRSGLSSEFLDRQSSVSWNQLFDHRKWCESYQVCSAYSEMKDDEGQPLVRLMPPGLPDYSSDTVALTASLCEFNPSFG
ncbi:hypothetical protein V6N13_014356 [Hibiscus sabdariffa]